MLTPIEMILFGLAVVVSLYYTWRGVERIIKNINSGKGKPDWNVVKKKAGVAIVKFLTFQPVFRFRLIPSILHGLIGWGFLAFLLINLGDLIYAYTGWQLLEHTGLFGDFYRLLADIAMLPSWLGLWRWQFAVLFCGLPLFPPGLPLYWMRAPGLELHATPRLSLVLYLYTTQAAC